MSTILQGKPLIMTKPFLRRAEHCMGKVSEAPDSAASNSGSLSTSDIAVICSGGNQLLTAYK